MRSLTLVGAVLLVLGCGPDLTAPAVLRAPHAVTTQELRPTDTSSTLMWRYGATDVVEGYGSDGGNFLVHYTRGGVNAVPATDTNDSGVPDFVEAVDRVYEDVGRLYHGPLGFRHSLSDQGFADNGGDGRFDVYLLDFARQADGAFRVDDCPTSAQCMGYVVQENDFAGYGYPNSTVATTILGSHEYFHAVQAAYSDLQDVVISEGTAVWATEQFDPSTSDFEGFLPGYLSRTDRSLDSPPPGPVPDFAYGSAIFFQFLTEKYGADVVRKLWEHLEPGKGDPAEAANVASPTWLVQLDALLKREHQSSFAQAFAEFSTWNLWVGTAANPTKSYAQGASYPLVAVTDLGLPVSKEALRVYYASAQYFRVPGAGRASMVAALVDNPSLPTSQLDGMALVVATRSAGKNLAVVTATTNLQAGVTVDTSAAEQVIIGVVNTRREGGGAVLSLRPSLCAGTAAEVATCRAALNPSFDAGVPDAGVADAGVEQDAGVDPVPNNPGGCGCSAVDPAALVLAGLALLLGRARR